MTRIEWVVRVADAIGGKAESWNPVVGCAQVSPGRRNCYAQRLAGTRLKNTSRYRGLTTDSKRGPVRSGGVRRHNDLLQKPLGWKKPRAIFVCDMGDLFHEDVPNDFLDRVFAVMALCPQHIFMVLTKRAERMRGYVSSGRSTPVGMEALELTLDAHHRDSRSTVGAGVVLTGDIAHLKVWPLPNAWCGVSAEDQARADERIPLLLDTPAAVRFVSAEPLLGPVSLFDYIRLDGPQGSLQAPPMLDWVIGGGESGPKARPMHPDWARALRADCGRAGAPFFFKQWGEYGPPDRTFDAIDGPPITRIGDVDVAGIGRFGRKKAGRLLDLKIHEQIPETERTLA